MKTKIPAEFNTTESLKTAETWARAASAKYNTVFVVLRYPLTDVYSIAPERRTHDTLWQRRKHGWTVVV